MDAGGSFKQRQAEDTADWETTEDLPVEESDTLPFENDGKNAIIENKRDKGVVTMLKYKRISEKDGVMRYEFYPDGNTAAPGVVEFEPGKDPKLIQHSVDDVKMYFAIHALNDIDTTKESGTIAWH